MKVIRKINTSAAIALDSDGSEIIILGKGVGFPKVPYELDDLSIIERKFYEVDYRNIDSIKSLPTSVLIASDEICKEAEKELNTKLNNNLPFTLADHLYFAIERLKDGIDLTGAIAYDIKHLYPKEYSLGLKGLGIFKKIAKVQLPKTEAISIAMHLINAEAKVDDIGSIMKFAKIINEIDEIIEAQLCVKLNKDSYEYSRYITHIRYLITRLSKGEYIKSKNKMILSSFVKEQPNICECVNEIANYLEGTWDLKCNDDEKLYMVIHINRVCP